MKERQYYSEKLIQKIKTYSNFNKHHSSIVQSSVFVTNTNDVKSITGRNQKKVNIYETLSYNIRNLYLEDLKEFLVAELEELKEKGEIKINTQFRRLLLLYDILKYKRSNA